MPNIYSTHMFDCYGFMLSCKHVFVKKNRTFILGLLQEDQKQRNDINRYAIFAKIMYSVLIEIIILRQAII